MGTLLKEEIKDYATSKGMLGEHFDEALLESCSYDLRVGSVFKGAEIISESHNNKSQVPIVEVKPSEIVTILTLEEVNLPKNILGTVFAINKLSSKGFLILNPGHIDPGFKGPISICAINLSKETFHLQIGKTKVFTILFEKLEKEAEGYNSYRDINRKDREEDFSIRNARKLSTSFFDLIKIEEYKEHLERVIFEIVIKRILKVLAVIGLLISVTVGAIKIFELFFEHKGSEVMKENRSKTDSIQKLKRQNDSLLNLINNNRVRL